MASCRARCGRAAGRHRRVARATGIATAASTSPACAGSTIRSRWPPGRRRCRRRADRRLRRRRPRRRSRRRSPPASHVVTANKALIANHGTALAAGRGEGRRARLRGGGGRRHAGRSRRCAKACRRQPHHARLRHPQRHLQLHPDRDARDRARLRRGAGRGAAARLRRSRSGLRHRRLRRGAQARDPRRRSRSARAVEFRRRSRSRASAMSTPSTCRWPRSSAFASSCSASRALTDDGLEQRVHPCMVPLDRRWPRSEACSTRVVVEGDFVGSTVYEGPRRRRGSDRLGRGRRSARPRRGPLGALSACRRRGSRRCRSRRWSVTAAPITFA